MQRLASIASFVGTAAGLFAQCQAPGTIRGLATDDPFTANFYLGSPAVPVVPDPGFAICSDWTIDGPIRVSQIDCFLFDDGTNPPQVGNSGPADVWICPTTYVGNEQNGPSAPGTVSGTPVGTGPWFLAGSGTCQVANSSNHSSILFGTPMNLGAGTFGVVIQVGVTTVAAGTNTLGRLHPLHEIPLRIPTVADQFLAIDNPTLQRITFTSSVVGPVGINLEVHYAPAPNSGESTRYGAGCYSRPQSFYQVFPPGAAFGLAPGAVQLTYLGPNYLVAAGTSTLAAPTGGRLNIAGSVLGTLGPNTAATATGAGTATEWDEAISTLQQLPASWGAGFPFPGGTTTRIAISSNGCVFLGPSLEVFSFYGDVLRFLDDQPRLAIVWGDQDCSAAGALLHYEIAPGDTHVDITWSNVPEWAPTPTGQPFTYQMRLYPTGQVDFVYATPITIAGAEVLAGFSYGNGAADPGNRNIVGSMPFVSGDGSSPAQLGLTARPVVGTTPGLRTEVAASTSLNLLILGFASQVPASPLAPFGMPDCFLHLGLPAASSIAAVAPAPAHVVALPIPNQPGFHGLQLFAQAAQFVAPTANTNPAGVLTSNGLCLRVGLQ